MGRNRKETSSYKRTPNAKASEIVCEQRNYNGPIPRDEQLTPQGRHMFSSATCSFEDPSRLPPVIAITVADYACPSFCTASMTCFGEVNALGEYCRAHDDKHIEYANRHNAHWKTGEEIAQAKEEGKWMDNESRTMEERLDLALRGEQVTWASMGASKMIPDMRPHVYAKADITESDFEFLHYNVWDWTYDFFAEQVSCEVIWLSYIPNDRICKDLPFPFPPDSAEYKNAMANARLSSDPFPDPMFVRAIRVCMDKPDKCYSRDEMFDVNSDKERRALESFSTRLFMTDKRFESEEEMLEDIEHFEASDINYTPIFDAMLGDG